MKILTAIILALSVLVFASWALAQSSAPAGQGTPSSPGGQQPSVTPQQGQTPEQQKEDLAECYEIAKAKTGIDPAALGLAKKAPSAEGEAQTGSQSGASAAADIAGAAASAAQHAAGGASGGTASSSTKETKLNKFQLANQACMQARGYLVKSPAAAPAAEPPQR